MNRFIRKILGKSNRKHGMLVVELFFSFIAFFIILSFIATSIRNSMTPMGFTYKNVYNIGLKLLNGNQDSTMKTAQEIFKYLNNYTGVEGVGKLYSSFLFHNGFMNPYKPLKYNNRIIPGDKVELMGADDNINKTLNIKMIEGRWFNSDDNASKFRPCIIGKSFKENILNNEKAIGKIIDVCEQQCIIVGVCEDFKHKGNYTIPGNLLILRDIQDQNLPYETGYCMTGSQCGNSFFVKFSNTAPPTIEEDITKNIYTHFPGYGITFSSLEKAHAKYLKRTWIPLLSILAVVIFLFINVLMGLFGVLWYNISLRKSEIALRMAVGANKANIYKQFIGELLALATLGVIPGLIIATQFPVLKVFEVKTGVYLIAMLIAALIIYLLVVLCALLPSAQAAKIQPAVALHEE